MESDSKGNILSSSVLVLNKFYTALRVITARRAFVFLAKNSAEVVHKNNGRFDNYRFEHWIEESRNNGREFTDYIHTPNVQIMVPRVIRLMEYGKLPRRELKFNRKNIMMRDNYQCQYCGVKRSPDAHRGGKKYALGLMTIDHVVPRSRGGTTEWTNVVTCCNKCNTRKGGRLPQEAGMNLIAKPQAPKFSQSIFRLLNDRKYTLWKEFVKDASEIG
ncbi:MAG: HNH endonuclease [Planctomycetota bacterium]